ncbi:hypothetical protein CKO44_21140 [Rubrivivax gelatinosus]|uniref:HTH araC/xylS-type domain-containing protein n=1 Tax=Rubrivivax gelatinosus TaxID=28068 RepID=A0ABS1DV97_RUBGE|nr:hypothetical protein [Rubrivivax gelatinosus]MBK1713922.1 hypothetical protein [Rubrivivax gelatinosus]
MEARQSPLRSATDNSAIEVTLALLDCGTLQLLEINRSALHPLASGHFDCVSMLVQIEGQALIVERRRLPAGLGDSCLVAPDRANCRHHQTQFRQVLVGVAAETLAACGPGWCERSAQRLDTTHPAVHAAGALARYLVGHGNHLAVEERVALGDALLRLIERVATRRRAVVEVVAGPEGAAARQRRQAEAFILERLHDRRLDVARIAAHLGVSTRYLHQLFAGGPQVMQWVQEQRLQACRRELAAVNRRPVAEVAWAWGFTSAAHFSRAFKKRFGVPPSAV